MNNFSKNINRIAKILFVGCLTLLFAQTAQAQDKIHKKSGKILNVKIVEIGVEDIRYRLQDQPEGVIYAVEKADVEKVVLENGLVQKFGEEAIDLKEVYAEQRKNVLKFSFLAPLAGYSSFTYERAIKPGHSWEAKLGIIGLGVNQFTDFGTQSGFFLSAGYKFITKPTYKLVRQRHAHILNGTYFRPDVAFGIYGHRISNSFACFLLSFGKQWIINDRFAIDFSIGSGFGTESSSNNRNSFFDITPSYGYIIEPNSGFAFSSGLSIGFLFDKPKAKTTTK